MVHPITNDDRHWSPLAIGAILVVRMAPFNDDLSQPESPYGENGDNDANGSPMATKVHNGSIGFMGENGDSMSTMVFHWH